MTKEYCLQELSLEAGSMVKMAKHYLQKPSKELDSMTKDCL